MGRIIVITSGKGGVGKTTSTVNIGMALAQLGRKVVLVDGDYGLRNLDLLLGLENRVVYTSLDVIQKECKLEQAVVKDKRQPNLGMLAAPQSRNKTAIEAGQMKELVENLSQTWDYVLIDCPAGIETGFQNAVAGAQEAIVVTTPEIAPVRDADRVIGLLEAQPVQTIKLLLNRFRPAMAQTKEMMTIEDVKEILAIDLIGVVPEDQQTIVASNKGEPLVFGQSLAALAYQNIAQRLEGKTIDLLDLTKMNNIWSRIWRTLTTKL
ncbi:MAG: septum site-determining protein MinD [Cyanobacteria bacterium KgW148]|nr:septum site-determining protein MinD [Cyanobacteria bacterium KgW148]